MSQIETLYAGSSALVEEHIVIGKDRIVRVPNNLKRLAIQNDHNIETVTFDCPRYWDGYDMSEMTVYINYRQANGEPGTYRAENVKADKYYVDTMHFTWTISKNVSMIPGKISFQVCIKKADEEGNEKHHWNSEICKDCHISESLACDAEEVMEQYPDIVEQWYRELIEHRNSGEFDGPPGVSPVVQVSDITGGHRITITDINGTHYFDVRDTYIDSSEAVTALLSEYATISVAEPELAPAIWFDLRDKENHSGIIKVKKTDGTIAEFYPSTYKENVIGLDTVEDDVNTLKSYFENEVTPIVHGGTGASDAETARKNLGAAAEEHEHDDVNTLKSYFDGDVAKIQNGGTGASDAETARKNLGAAATNHTHSTYENSIKILQSYFSDGGAIHMKVQGCNDTDLNTLVEQGIYAGYTGMTNTAANDISIIEVMPYSNDWIMQRQTVISSTPAKSATYIRFRYSGTTWTPWRRMLSNILHPDDYGVRDTADGLPADAVKGQIFFKKVVD